MVCVVWFSLCPWWLRRPLLVAPSAHPKLLGHTGSRLHPNESGDIMLCSPRVGQEQQACAALGAPNTPPTTQGLLWLGLGTWAGIGLGPPTLLSATAYEWVAHWLWPQCHCCRLSRVWSKSLSANALSFRIFAMH